MRPKALKQRIFFHFLIKRAQRVDYQAPALPFFSLFMQPSHFFTFYSPFGIHDPWVFNPVGYWQCPDTARQVYIGSEAAYILPTKGRKLGPGYMARFSILHEPDKWKSLERQTTFYHGRCTADYGTLPLKAFQVAPILDVMHLEVPKDGLIMIGEPDVFSIPIEKLEALPFINYQERADGVYEIKSQGLPEWPLAIKKQSLVSCQVDENELVAQLNFKDGAAICLGYTRLELKFLASHCTPLARQFPETWDEWMPLHLLPDLAKSLYLQAVQNGSQWTRDDLMRIAYWENTLAQAIGYGLNVDKALCLFLDFIARYELETLFEPARYHRYFEQRPKG
jgi:hypothetical protein